MKTEPTNRPDGAAGRPCPVSSAGARFGRGRYWAALVLTLSVLAVFAQIGSFEFVDYDDYLYVVDNSHVKAGLSRKNVIWAFSTVQAANWHPLTMMSHMLDVSLYGLNPGPHHISSLLFHIANTLLLFIVFRRMTGALYRSAFLAALFALHPLHVESVAQVACRKDVLSTFFWLLAMLAHIRYVARPGGLRYLALFSATALGLMAKPMVVTLPFVLLLVDFWPLGRFRPPDPLTAGPQAVRKFDRLRPVWEKVPLMALTAAACTVTFLAQKAGGAVASLVVYPFDVRLANALVSYGRYLAKTLWPTGLSVLYPHPGMWPLWQVAGATILLLVITVGAFRTARRYPYIVFGWLWFVGTLVPVIGLVQVGEQAMADRYTYVPLIGLFVIVAWGSHDLLKRRYPAGLMFSIGMPAVILLLMGLSWFQTAYWKNSRTLFGHAVAVTHRNATAHNNLGVALEREGHSAEAIRHYRIVLDIDPKRADTHNNLGNALKAQNKISEAAFHYSAALRLNPRHAKAYNNLGNILSGRGEYPRALEYYHQALSIEPAYADAHYNIGNVMMKTGRFEPAILHYRAALRIDPFHLAAQNNLANVFFKLGRLDDARRIFSDMLAALPGNDNIRSNLNVISAMQDRMNSKIRSLREGLRENPADPELNNRLGALYKRKRDYKQAEIHYRRAISSDPGLTEALEGLSVIYAMRGEYDSARTLLQRIVSRKPDAPAAYYLIAGIHSRQKHLEASGAWLARAIEKGFCDRARLESDPNFDNLRMTPAYKTIVAHCVPGHEAK